MISFKKYVIIGFTSQNRILEIASNNFLRERDGHVEFHDDFKFEWDENKHRDNVKKHKVTFHEATTVFQSSLFLTENDNLHSQDETRYKTTGYSVKNRLLVVIHTERGNVIRIISARKANKLEQEHYHELFR